MSMLGSGGGDDSSEDHLTDIDEDLLYPDETPGDEIDLEPGDYTDLDDALLRFHRTEDLSDRYGPLGLTLVTLVHFLPAFVGLLPGALAIDTSSLAPSVGLDVYFATGVVVFFSGVAAHLAREYGSRYLLRYALAVILGGSIVYVLALGNAVLAPGRYLAGGGIADGIFAQLNAGVVALSLIGGLLVVARLGWEAWADASAPSTGDGDRQ